MPVISDEESNAFLSQPAPLVQGYPVAPSSLGALGAAFRLENPVVAAIELARRPAFPEEQGYDLAADLAAVPELSDNYREAFSGTKSRVEFQYRAAKLRKEIEDEQKLTAAGLPGVLYAMGAGLLSPTTLMPIVGATRALRAGTALGRVLGTGAAVAGSSAGAVAIDEAVLRAANLSRTDFDTALNIGGAVVLGGALGGLLGKLAPDVRARAAREVEDELAEPTQGLTPAEADADIRRRFGADLSAARADVLEPGTINRLGGAGRAVAQMSPAVAPTIRAQEDYGIKTYATIQQQISSGGLKVTSEVDPQSELGLRRAVAPGGQLEGLIRGKERSADAVVVDLVARAWSEIEDIKGGLFWRGRAEAAAILRGRLTKPKRMTYAEFSDELMRTMHRGDTSEVPEIAALAKEIRAKVINPLTEAAQRAGLVPNELSEELLKGAKSYLMRVYDHERMRLDPEGFKQILILSSKERLEAKWTARLQELREKQANATQELEDRTRSLEEAAKVREEIQGEIDNLSQGPTAFNLSNVNNLRREAREAAKTAKGLAAIGDPLGAAEMQRLSREYDAQAKALKEADEGIDELVARKRALGKRLRNLNKSIFKLRSDQQRLVDRADATLAVTVRELQRVSKKIVAAQVKLASASDEAFDELLDETFKDLFKVYEQIEKREATLAGLAEKFPELNDMPDELLTRVQRWKEDVFGVERFDARGPKGEKMLRISGELEQREALQAIDAVLEEGEIKTTKKALPPAKMSVIENAGAEQGYFYHITSAENLDDIRETGLEPRPYDFGTEQDAWPDGSQVDRIYFGKSPRNVIAFTPDRQKPLLLRTKEAAKPERDTGDYYNENGVAANKLEYLAEDGRWQSLDGDSLEFTELSSRQRKSLETLRKDIAKLRWSDAEALARAERRFDSAIARNLEAEERARRLADRLEFLRGADRDAIRRGLDEELQELAKTSAEKIHRRALVDGKLRARAAQIQGERIPEAQREIDALKTMPETLKKEFEDRLFDAKADDWDLEKGTFDFDRILRKTADELFHKMATQYVRAPAFDFMSDERGPALVRMLDIDIEKKFDVGGRQVSMADYLVKDAVAVLRTYVRTIVPDTEIAQRFQDAPSIKTWLAKAEQEYADLARYIEEDKSAEGVPLTKTRSREEKEKLLARLAANHKYGQQAVKVLLDRLRHVDGLPQDPTDFWSRLARTWRMGQVPIYMGMVAISSIPEIMMPVFKYGIANTFKDSWAPLVSNFKEWARAAAEAGRAGQGLDPQLNTRFMAFNDMEEMNIRYTKFEQLVEFFATKTGTVALFDQWTKLSKMIAAPVASAQFTRALETVMTGKAMMPRERALYILANAGVNDELAQRVWRAMNEGEMTRGSGGAIIPNTDTWTDYAARDVYRAYMSRELDITTITPGVERPMWTTGSEPARIINQFRSFGWSANTKMLLAGVQQRDAAVVQAYLAMLALGTVSYAAWAAVQGPGTKAWEDFENADVGKFMDEAIYRSGLLAAFGDVHSLLSDIPATRGLVNFSDQGAEKLRDPKILDTLIGVSATTARKINTVLGGIHDPTQATTGAARKLIFYNNVWWFRRLLEEIETGTAEALGIPERRG